MSEVKELPKGWEWKKLEKLGKIETGTTPSKSNTAFYGDEFPFYKPTDLEAGENVITSNDGLTKLGIDAARFVPENSILVTCIGATIGKTGLIKRGGCFNQQINAIVPLEDVDPKYLYYQIIGLHFQKQILNNASSTTLPIINKGKFKELLIAIPPSIKTQQAIVAKIEELFSEVEKGIETLRTAQQQLKTYRQSVLKWAFEGKLTNMASYSYCKIGDVTDMQAGVAFKKSEYSKDGIRLFQIANVSFNHTSWEQVEYLPNNYSKLYPELLLKNEDIVMALNRPLLNDKLKIGQINNSDLPAILYQRVGRFKFAKGQHSKYFLYFLQSSQFIKWLKEQLQGVNIPFINKSKLLGYDLYPNREFHEQLAIVEEIESRLSVADKMEESIATSLQQAEALKQSILKMAFEGRLV